MCRRINLGTKAILISVLCFICLQICTVPISAKDSSNQHIFHVTYENCSEEQFTQYVEGDICDGTVFNDYGVHTLIIPNYYYESQYQYSMDYADLKVPGLLNEVPEMEIVKLEINGTDYTSSLPTLRSLYSMDGWDNAENDIVVDGVECIENEDDPFMSGRVTLFAQTGTLQLMFSNTVANRDIDIHIVFAGEQNQNTPSITISDDQQDLGTAAVEFVKNIDGGAQWKLLADPKPGYRLDKVVDEGGNTYESEDGRTILLTITQEDASYTVFFRKEQDPVSGIMLSNYGSYPGAKLWLNTLSSVIPAEYEDDYTLQYFLTDTAQGTLSDAVISGATVTFQDEKEAVQGKESTMALRDSKLSGGLLLDNIPAGQYYVGCAATTASRTYYTYEPFYVYATPKEYLQTGLDRLINSYRTDWFLKDGQYVGLDDRTDYYGNEWEAWIFTALGDKYNLNGETISFSPTASFLHPGQVSYLNRYSAVFDEQALTERGPKQLFKDITSIIAFGGDPRNINGNNYVKALVRNFCKADGAPAIDQDGKVYFPAAPDEEIDVLVLSYGILGLEIAGASEIDGYTDALRSACIKTLVGNRNDTDTKHSVSDIYMMSLIPLYFLEDDADYGAKCKQILANCKGLVTKYNLGSNGAMQYVQGTDDADTVWGTPNANTEAVSVNTLVLAGLTADDLASGDFQKSYGSLLTSLCGEIVEGGALYGGLINRMATYQTLGALVDLYNGKSCFEIAAEKYRKNYPQYFEEKEEEVKPTPSKPQAKPNYTPARAKITKLTKGKEAFTVKWKKVKNATYYQIQYSTKKSFKSKKTVKVKNYLKKGKKIRNLKSKKKYFVRVRAIRKVGKKTYYGKWSKARSVKVK